MNTSKDLAMTKPDFFRVEKSAKQPECQCANCVMWTVVSGVELVKSDDNVCEIGTAWQGEGGLEAAEDTRDLMNMAFDMGRETAESCL